jgi:hypothetical protein
MKRALLIATLIAGSAGAAPPMRVAVLPLHDLGLGSEALVELEHAIVEQIAALPGMSVANLSANGRLVAGPRLSTIDQPIARAQALAREVGATRALVIDAARLGDGQVVYLQGVDPKAGSIGSTTASLSGAHPPTPEDLTALRGAVVRILDPEHYVGRILVKLDVKGAEVQIDGRPVTADLSRPIEVGVGTHALRVTHPAYHDFLRFIEVPYGALLTLDVPLAAYPLTEGEMAERQRRHQGPVRKIHVPWYRSWWALSLAGVVLTGVTAGIVIGARPGVSSDRSLSYQRGPTP